MTTAVISADKSLLDHDAIFTFLSTCYWSPGIARERVERAITNSMCFAAYDSSIPRPSDPSKPSLVGFARLVTDKASFAYLCDVFVLESHRGRGISKQLMQAILAHPELQGLRRFALFTRDAHKLYAQFGFAPTADPARYMERLDRESFKRP